MPTMSRAEQSRVLRYDYLRVILVVLVVLSHCSYYDIITPFGGINYQSMMLTYGISDTKVHWAIKIVSNYLYSFHMPAFFALSGCLFWKQIEQHKWTLTSLVVKKTKRLILPLLTTWLFWNIPIKYISGYYHGVPFSKVLLQLIFPNRVYLWYLESLFIVFIIVYLIVKFCGNESLRSFILLFMYTIGIILQYYDGDFIPFGNPMRYCIWFYLGKHIERILDKIGKHWWISCSILMVDIGLFLIFRHAKETLLIFIVKDFSLAFIGIILMFILSKRDENILIKHSRAIRKISDRSMDIYLYSEPLNYLILSSEYSVFGITSFGVEWISFGIFILRFFGTFIAAYFISLFISIVKQKFQSKRRSSYGI